jgi:hypothetical protein
MVDIAVLNVTAAVEKQPLIATNVRVEEVLDVKIVMMVLLNAVLVVVYMKWIVQTATDLEKMVKVQNVQVVRVQELTLARNAVVKT